MKSKQIVETMDTSLGRRRYQGYRMATAPEISRPVVQPIPFRHATHSFARDRFVYEPLADGSSSRSQTNDDFEVDLSSRPRSGATSPQRHSFDSDLRNYFHREHRYSLPSDGEEHERGEDSGPSLFEFALNRYGVTLIPIIPQKEKEKEKRSLSKLFSGSIKRKPSISGASNPQHVRHVEYDSHTGQFLGLPEDWERHLTSGLSGDKWGALISERTASTYYDAIPPLDPERTSFAWKDDPKRSTLSSTVESIYSDNSRYRQPAERPPSFTSTTASTYEDFTADYEELRDLEIHAHSHTPRPLPHTPLL